MPSPAWVTPPNPAPGNVIAASHVDDLATDALYLKDRTDNPPRVRAYHSTTQSIANGSATAVALNNEAVDSATIHDNSTNNSRLTIPTGEDGFWLFALFVEFASNATGQRKLELRRGGADFFAGVTVDAAAGSNATRIAFAFAMEATAGQYFEMVVTQNSGGSLNLEALPYFVAIRIA